VRVMAPAELTRFDLWFQESVCPNIQSCQFVKVHVGIDGLFSAAFVSAALL
jgi:hypothetical protein